MPGFIRFLNAYTTFPDKKEESKHIEKRRAIVKGSATHVHEAQHGQLGKLGRLFNEYPISFTPDEKKESVLFAVDEPLMQKWLDECFDITLNGKISIVMPTSASEEIADTDSFVTADDATKKRIDFVLKEMILKGCQELLDEKGQLTQEIVDKFALQPLIDSCEGRPQKLKEIYNQIIFSYVSQIILTNFTTLLSEMLREKFKGDLTQASQKEQNIFALFVYMISQIFDKKTSRITQYIQHITQEYIDAAFRGKSLAERCVDELTHISALDLHHIISLDLVTSLSLSEKIKIFEPGVKTLSFLEEKIKFWLDVVNQLCTKYETQGHDEDLSRSQAIFMALLPLFNDTAMLFSPALKKTFDDCEKYMGSQLTRTKTVSAVEKKEEKHTILEESKLTHEEKEKKKGEDISQLMLLLRCVDNILCLNHFLKSAAIHEMNVKEKQIYVLDKIRKMKLDKDLLQKPTDELFGMIMNIAAGKAGTTFNTFLHQFKFGLFGQTGESTSLIKEVKPKKSIWSAFRRS